MVVIRNKMYKFGNAMLKTAQISPEALKRFSSPDLPPRSLGVCARKYFENFVANASLVSSTEDATDPTLYERRDGNNIMEAKN